MSLPDHIQIEGLIMEKKNQEQLKGLLVIFGNFTKKVCSAGSELVDQVLDKLKNKESENNS